MVKEFINPNWHVILIHFPLGVFLLGMMLEVLCLLFRHRGSLRGAARWMVVLGALSMLPAAYAGMYAMVDIARRTATPLPDTATWHEIASASSMTERQWEMIESHAWANGGATAIAAVLVTIAVACSDRWRARLYPLLLVLLLGCAAVMSVGAWYGGEMVYREGVAVRLPYADDEAHGEPTTTRPALAQAADPAAAGGAAAAGAAAPADSPAAETQRERPRGVDYYANPLQTHVSVAGLAAALGMLGIGLSLRATFTSPHWRDPELSRAGVEALPHPQRGGAEDMAVLRSFAPNVEVTGESEHIPVSRFWLLTFIVSAGASLAGWWVLGDEHETYRPQDLWALVMTEGHVRRMAHVIAAGAIVVLPLFMAILGRVARRSRAMVGMFGLLLALAIGAQVWLGVLLMYDQPRVPEGSGAWYRFQQPPAGTPGSPPAGAVVQGE